MTAKSQGEVEAAARSRAVKVIRDLGHSETTVEMGEHRWEALPKSLPEAMQNVKNTTQLEGRRFTVVVRLPEDVPEQRVHDLADAIVADINADGTLGGQVHSTTVDESAEIARDPRIGYEGDAWRLNFPVTSYWLINKVAIQGE